MSQPRGQTAFHVACGRAAGGVAAARLMLQKHGADARALQDAHELYGDLTQILRAAHGADFDPEKASEPFARRICLAAHCEDLACTADRLDECARTVRGIFDRTIGPVRFRATD